MKAGASGVGRLVLLLVHLCQILPLSRRCSVLMALLCRAIRWKAWKMIALTVLPDNTKTGLPTELLFPLPPLLLLTPRLRSCVAAMTAPRACALGVHMHVVLS